MNGSAGQWKLFLRCWLRTSTNLHSKLFSRPHIFTIYWLRAWLLNSLTCHHTLCQAQGSRAAESCPGEVASPSQESIFHPGSTWGRPPRSGPSCYAQPSFSHVQYWFLRQWQPVPETKEVLGEPGSQGAGNELGQPWDKAFLGLYLQNVNTLRTRAPAKTGEMK